MTVPANIQELADKNEALLANLGFEPEVDDPFELCSEQAYLRSGLFPEEIIPLMFGEHSDAERVPNCFARIAENIGTILVRPDMTHVSNEFESFISNRFEIVHTASPVIDKRGYWQLYQHDIYRPETMHSRLTRAALYIGSACRLVVFKTSAADAAVEPLADRTRNRLRGHQGIAQKNTLRGDIVYHHSLKLGLHRLDDRYIDPRLKLAADPFTAYRKLAADSHHECRKLVYPLLFFTGVGVHVPDYREIGNDLLVFMEDLSPYISQEAA